jgi:RecA/RadA recombinase
MEKTNKQVNKSKLDLDKIISKVRASYGKEKSLAEQVSLGSTITKPKDDDEFVLWENSPWSELTNCRGLVMGRIHQVAGRPDSGKSTTAMQCMKLAQDQDCLVILWDTENKWSTARFVQHFKGDPSRLITITSRMILEGAEEIERVIHAAKEQDSSCRILIVWDSVAATLAKNEGESSITDSKQLAVAAKEVGLVMRAFVRLMEKYKNRETNKETICLMAINQTYANIGSVGQKESGGQKLEYFSSIILQLTRKSDLTKIKDGIKRKIGIVSRAKVRKNHLFDGTDSIAELDLTVTAGGIELLSKQKTKKETTEASDWSTEDGEVELEGDE